MHTAATDGTVGSTGSGRTAFEHIATILPTVSVPSRVVRSVHRIARSSAQSLASRLIERVASEAARSSNPTESTADLRVTILDASDGVTTGDSGTRLLMPTRVIDVPRERDRRAAGAGPPLRSGVDADDPAPTRTRDALRRRYRVFELEHARRLYTEQADADG